MIFLSMNILNCGKIDFGLLMKKGLFSKVRGWKAEPFIQQQKLMKVFLKAIIKREFLLVKLDNIKKVFLFLKLHVGLLH